MKKSFFRQTGFTLIEMMIVIFIISLLSVMILADYKKSQKKYILINSVQQLVSDIHKAQNVAMSGTDISENNYYGYGVYFQSVSVTSYIIFADKNGSKKYDSSDDIIQIVNLPLDVKIKSISVTPLHIFFAPPAPDTYINGSHDDGVYGTITLEVESAGLSMSVNVSTSGLVQQGNIAQ
ncbi:MAG: prepilin-type N-terminal cleavage/methylation domain-containing protein [bacterium]